MLTGIMSKVTASIKTDTFSDITLSSTEEGRDMTPSSPSRGCVANSHRLTVAVGGEHFVRRGAWGVCPTRRVPIFLAHAIHRGPSIDYSRPAMMWWEKEENGRRWVMAMMGRISTEQRHWAAVGER